MTQVEGPALLRRAIRDRHTGCLRWTGAKNPNGYGKLKIKGRTKSVHRLAYELWVGPIPDGLQIDHLCRNRDCIEPTHLEAVTQAENVRRSLPFRKVKTHCPRGHEYSPENTLNRKNGQGYPSRQCRTCARARHKAVDQRRAQQRRLARGGDAA